MAFNATDNDTSNYPMDDGCPATKEGSSAERVIKTIACILVLLVAVLANIFVIFIVSKKQRIRSVTNCLVANMACSDLLIGSVNMPNMIVELVRSSSAFSFGGPLASLLCKLLVFSQDISTFCSIMCLIAIAIERYLAIFYPFKKYFTLRNVKYVLLGCWVVAGIVASPLLYANKIVAEDGLYYCSEQWSPVFGSSDIIASRGYTTVTFVLLYAIPLVSICSLYTAVVYRLWHQTIPGDHRTPERRQHRAKAKKHVLKMLIAIVVAFAICWLPFHVFFFLDNFHPPYEICGAPDEFYFAATFLAFSNSAISPCIFIFFDIGVRRYLSTSISPCLQTITNHSNHKIRHRTSAYYSSHSEAPISFANGVKLKDFKAHNLEVENQPIAIKNGNDVEQGANGLTIMNYTPDIIAGHRNKTFTNEIFVKDEDTKRRTVSFAEQEG